MNKFAILIAFVFSGVCVAAGIELRTNQMMIGNEIVETKLVNGELVGERLVIIGSNRVIGIRVKGTPSEEWRGVPANVSSIDIPEPKMQLLLHPGNNETQFGRVKGYYGHMYFAAGWRIPSLSQTNRVEILSSEHKTKIVVLAGDNGPIYSSTNSGMTWNVITAPGEYEFVLTSGPHGGGFIAVATIHPSPQGQTGTNFLKSNWYVVGSAPDGSKLAVTGDNSQSTPVLSITPSDGGVVVSWPAEFTGFVLQETTDLITANWVDVTNSVDVVGGENQVLMSSPAGNNFYRLRSQ